MLAVFALLAGLIAARSQLDARVFRQEHEQGEAELPAPPAPPQLASKAGAVNPRLARRRDGWTSVEPEQAPPAPQGHGTGDVSP